MVFSNLVFLFVFLPVVLFVYFIAPKLVKNIVLLIASLFFYAWGEPDYLFLMLFSISVNYLFGLWIQKYQSKIDKKKLILTLAIFVNIGLLGYYKYANFFVDLINGLFQMNIHFDPLPLPIGISFYTFHAISYLIHISTEKRKRHKKISLI